MKKSFEALGLRWSRTRERGATAVVIAICLLLVMAAAAVSFDTANLALHRQKLQNLTDAAAQAGAVYLRDHPMDLTGAKQAALNYAYTYDKSFTLADMTLYCIVPSNGAATNPDVATGNIGRVCDPLTTAKKTCDQSVCAIVCELTGAVCNAIRVYKEESVDYYFAPAVPGLPHQGTTGGVGSVSCAKSCGGAVNPVDVAIIADRTPSMTDSDFADMQTGIKSALGIMTPELQFVTLGTIHRSNPDPNDPLCRTKLGPAVSTSYSNGHYYYPDGGARNGSWMLPDFSNNYLGGLATDPVGTRPLKVAADFNSLGYQVTCMDHVWQYKLNSNGQTVANPNFNGYPWGTHLAAPLKAAARMLLQPPATYAAQDALRQPLLKNGEQVEKWIILETDGNPAETMANATVFNSPPYKDTHTTSKVTTDLTNSDDPSAPGNTQKACDNLLKVANNAKNATNNIHIITIAYGDANTASCGVDSQNKPRSVASVLAQVASAVNFNPSTPSKAPTDCASANTDGDYFFCAASGTDLKKIFWTALGMTAKSTTKYVAIPK